MSEKKFLSMSQLSESVAARMKKLESGSLSSEELEDLKNDARDLYERLVVLEYKALEKGLKTKSVEPSIPVKKEEIKPLIENQKQEVTSTPSFKFSTGIDSTKKEEIKTEIKKQEPEQVYPQVQASFFDSSDTLETKKESINEKIAQEKTPSIAEKYASTSKTSIADKFANDQKQTLADKLKMTRINDLRSAIGINQKFLFMNDLFEGENTEFNTALTRLNSCNNGDEAQSIMSEYAQKYNWSADAERVQQFSELITRRYL